MKFFLLWIKFVLFLNNCAVCMECFMYLCGVQFIHSYDVMRDKWLWKNVEKPMFCQHS